MTSVQRGTKSGIRTGLVIIFSIIIISLLVLIVYRQESTDGIGELFKFDFSNKQQTVRLKSIGNLQNLSNKLVLNLIPGEATKKVDSSDFQAIPGQLAELTRSLKESNDPNHLNYLNRLNSLSNRMDRNQAKLISRLEIMHSLNQNAELLLALIPSMMAKNDELVSVLISAGADNGTVYVATRQMMFLERIKTNIIIFLNLDANKSVIAADRFGRDASLLLRIYDDLKSGSKSLRIKKVKNKKAQLIISDLLKNHGEISHNISSMLDRAPDYFLVQTSMQDYLQEVTVLMQILSELHQYELSNR